MMTDSRPTRHPAVDHHSDIQDSAPAARSRWYNAVKPILDVSLALVLLAPAAPLILLCGLLVKLTSPGPALYSQTRVGRFGRIYRIFKIRTMRHNCESVSGVVWSPGDDDPRVTPVGRFLRRSHLDELPQLWNVVRGEMSLVGPRPERPEIVPVLEQAIPTYRQRLLVKPGVTGLAQIQLPADTDLWSVRNKLVLDSDYVERYGLWLDLRILVGTSLKVAGVPYQQIRSWLALAGPGPTDAATFVILPAVDPAPPVSAPAGLAADTVLLIQTPRPRA